MSERSSSSKLGLLEIVHDPNLPGLAAFCPYRDKTIDAGICFACKDCSGLALSPDGKTSYVVCERAAADGVWVEGGGEKPAEIHSCCGCGREGEPDEPDGA